ncbi:MAG: ABC transporter substrate-binding protein [Solirubrobacteraceae bacterium]|nr:ABC transporter substrate-binding protein [Solirubrobacteraceae bacterium]
MPSPRWNAAATVISRRRSTSLPAAGLSAAALTGLTLALASCGDTDVAKSAGSLQPFTGTAPKATGDLDTLKWAVQAEPATLDTTLAVDSALTQSVANVVETLLRSSPSGKVEPGLATSVETPDPKTRVYEIRPGVTFHDGTPLTADDVVASLDRARDPDHGSVWVSAFGSVSSVKATGPLQVTVKLKRPDVLFDSYLATTAGAIESKAFLAKAGKDYGSPQVGVNGTGPYELERWTKGQSFTLNRAATYWDPSLKAHAKTVQISFLPDAAARTNALLTGGIDGSYELDPSTYAKLQRSGKGRLFLTSGINAYHLVPLNKTSALGDVRVRRALSLALDRQGINGAAWAGTGTIARGPAASGAWQTLVPNGRELWAEAPEPKTDLAEAKRLVGEAGATGKKIVLVYHTTFALFPTVANAVASAGREIGLDVQLRPQPFAKAVSVYFNPKDRRGYDLAIYPETPQTADPTELSKSLTTGNAQNFGDWSDPAYDALVDEALGEPDPQARAATLVKAQAILSEQLPWIPLVEPAARVFLRSGIAGAPTTIAPRQGYPWAALVGTGDTTSDQG